MTQYDPYSDEPEYGYQKHEALRDATADAYASTRANASLGTHIAMAIGTTLTMGAPWSLIFSGVVVTRALYGHLDAGLGDIDHVRSGNDLAANIAAEKFSHSENPKSNAIRAGLKDGIIGTLIQPVAWAALGVTSIIDMIGHAGRGIDVGIASMQKKSDEVIREKSHSAAFGKTNSLRDAFWKVGAISPSKQNARTIMENSGLDDDKTLSEQRRAARWHTYK